MADSILKKVTSFFHRSEKKPVSQPVPQEETFNWKDSTLWSDVQTRSAEGVHYGHRINIQNLTPEQRNQIKAGLEKRHIKFTERQATQASEDIRPGDLTIRITDPKSVETLRAFVFNWAIGPGMRPVFKTNEEYDAEQKLIREKRSQSVVQDDTPKWADKRYWAKTSGVNDGKLETTYVMDLGDPNDHLHDNPQPFGSGVEIVKALSAKGIDATIGRSITNGLPSYLMTHDSVIISGAENVERFEKTVLRQTKAPALTPNKDYDR